MRNIRRTACLAVGRFPASTFVILALTASLVPSGCGDDGATVVDGGDGAGLDAGSTVDDAGAEQETGPGGLDAGPVDAGPPIGACCSIDGTCEELTEVACDGVPRNHSWRGGYDCGFLCPDERMGACCSREDGECMDDVTVDACSGLHAGEGSTCAETDCSAL